MAVITLSRQIGALGDEIGKGVAGSLSYSHIDKENILGEAERFGLQRSDLERLDEKKPSLRDRIFKDRLLLYRRLVQSIIFQFAKNGSAVIVGGGAYHILKDVPGVLRVKVIAPMEVRVKRVMQEAGVSKDEAISLISQSDSNREGFMKHVFDIDWMDATKYDLVLNTGQLGKDDACQILIGAVTTAKIQRESQEGLRVLAKQALSKKVEALLHTDKRIDARYISVSVEEPGVVRLQGAVNSEGEKRVAETLAFSVAETIRVANELAVSVIPVTQPEPM